LGLRRGDLPPAGGLEQVGGFDEGFFMYAEDMDWCYRAHAAGWQVWYSPGAEIVHHIGRSSDQVPLKMVIEFHRSMARFYRKHYAPGGPRQCDGSRASGCGCGAGRC